MLFQSNGHARHDSSSVHREFPGSQLLIEYRVLRRGTGSSATEPGTSVGSSRSCALPTTRSAAQERQLTSQALDLERVRIARELHDGIAHHITGVGIHAAAARRSLEKNPDKARESLKTIESSTRETVDELRALVYTLRDTDDANTAEHNTKGNPSLGDIPELIDVASRSGQQIERSHDRGAETADADHGDVDLPGDSGIPDQLSSLCGIARRG